MKHIMILTTITFFSTILTGTVGNTLTLGQEIDSQPIIPIMTIVLGIGLMSYLVDRYLDRKDREQE